jgi:cytochrome bd ubiquinol oxidase subunit II
MVVTPEEYGFALFWYIIIIAAVICYAMLDGFDLGVGALHLCAKTDEERRIFLNAIGPVWDGNEVWLVVTLGGLLAGFPVVYATLLSAFYLPLTILIFALIFRAVAIEFRSKHPSKRWRSGWDFCFFLGSLVIALAVGISIGNLIQGIPLNEEHIYIGGDFSTFLRPYPVLVGILTLSLFMNHGAIYLVMKTEGDLQQKLREWVQPTMIYFIFTYAVTTIVTLIYETHMTERFRERPYLFSIVIANMLAIADIPREVNRGRYGLAFIDSCANIALLMALFALGTFPDVIRSSINPSNGITILNAAASLTTLKILMIIVAIGLPLVFAYGYYIYRLFRGKVRIDKMSY